MSRKKIFVEKLEKKEITTLKNGFKYGKSADFRQRCHILLISHKGYEVKEIAEVLEVNPQTVYATLSAWKKYGLAGLMRKKGQGRKPILEPTNLNHTKAVKKAIEKHGLNYSMILEDVTARLRIEKMSKKSLSRFLDRLAEIENNSEN